MNSISFWDVIKTIGALSVLAAVGWFRISYGHKLYQRKIEAKKNRKQNGT